MSFENLNIRKTPHTQNDEAREPREGRQQHCLLLTFGTRHKLLEYYPLDVDADFTDEVHVITFHTGAGDIVVEGYGMEKTLDCLRRKVLLEIIRVGQSEAKAQSGEAGYAFSITLPARP